jgi:hypothetical protein
MATKKGGEGQGRCVGRSIFRETRFPGLVFAPFSDDALTPVTSAARLLTKWTVQRC